MENRRSPAKWDGAGSGVGGFRSGDPEGVACVIGRTLARRFSGRLVWKDGQLIALFHQKRPPKWEYERERAAVLAPLVKGPPTEEAIAAWGRFEAKYGESKSAAIGYAAREWGFSYATLHRLAHGKAEWISWQTVRRLRARLRPHELRALEQVLYPEPMRTFLAELRGEVRRLEHGRSRHDEYRLTQEIREEVSKFERLCRKLGMPPLRLRLAMLRVFDPLVAAPSVRRRRPAGRALSHQQTVQLIKLGFRRERVLLQAERSLLR